MADQSPDKLRSGEQPPERPQARESVSSSQVIDKQGREAIAGTLAEGAGEGGEMVEIGETVSEAREGAREQQGDGAKSGKKDDGSGQSQQDDGQNPAAGFLFDENQLPPAPKMIAKIEQELRVQIKKLEKEANKYKGGLFRQPDYTKYNETMSEIRQRNVILKRLVSMAVDAIKKMYIQMFKPKEKL